jgi:hypothetical protein
VGTTISSGIGRMITDLKLIGRIGVYGEHEYDEEAV